MVNNLWLSHSHKLSALISLCGCTEIVGKMRIVKWCIHPCICTTQGHACMQMHGRGETSGKQGSARWGEQAEGMTCKGEAWEAARASEHTTASLTWDKVGHVKVCVCTHGTGEMGGCKGWD